MRLAAKHSGPASGRNGRRVKILLERGEAMPLRGGAGRTVHAHAGRVWITEENRPDDVVLQAGESVRLDRHGLAIVEALSDAAISVQFQL